jgi:hypothetical protein
MPHKYEREIEEILRNLERTNTRQDPGDRITQFARPAARRPRVSLPSQLEVPVALILLGIIVALIGSGFAFYQTQPSLISGIIALVGFVLFAVGVALSWSARFRGVSPSARSLRRPQTSDNVVRIRPVRSNPLSRLATRLRMRRMRRRYRNFSDH